MKTQSTNEVSRQPPKIIHVIMRKHVSKQVADPLARWNISVNLLPARKDLLQRTVLQQITRNFAQRLTGIKNIAVRIHPRKHRRVALEAAESKQRLNRSRRAVDRLNAPAPPFDDLIHQRLVLRILQKRQVWHFLHLRGLRRKNNSLLPAPVQQPLDFTDVPLLDHRADGDAPRAA